MFRNQTTLIVGTLAAAVTLTACESSPKVEETATVAVTPDSAIAVDTFTTTATVTAINASKRTLTLTGPGGHRTTCKAGKDVVNFDQIQVGDQVKATVTEEYAVLLSRGASLSAGAGQAVALTPIGAKPGVYMADTAQATARVQAIDPQHHKVTLQFVDG